MAVNQSGSFCVAPSRTIPQPHALKNVHTHEGGSFLSPQNSEKSPENQTSALGFIYSKTSGTPYSKKPENLDTESSTSILITRDQQYEARLKRMRKMILTSARLQEEEMKQKKVRYKAAFITLTYKPGDWWRPDHISVFIRHCRQWCNRKGIQFRYVWVAEIQEGRMKKYEKNDITVEEALHYHVLVWLPKGVSFPKPDKQGWWKHGMTKIEWAKNPVGYIAKYASKGGDYCFPKHCRICGSGGLSKESRNERTWWLSPKWVRDYWAPSDQPRRKIGGGFVSLNTGEFLASPWLVTMEPLGIRIIRITPPPNYSWRGPMQP